MIEIWKDIPSYEGYYSASNTGKIRSNSRLVWVSPSPRSKLGHWRPIRTRLLNQILSSSGSRYAVSLWKNHKLRVAFVHVLVLEAFIGLRPDGMYGCHKDDDIENNTLDNLYWGTPTQNSADKIRNGNQPCGEGSGPAKLTNVQIDEIRNLSGKISQDNIAIRYGIAQSQVSRIVNRKHWKHLT